LNSNTLYNKFLSDYPLLSAIGNTPMVHLKLPKFNEDSSIYVKLENVNPGGSIKDRPVLRMIASAIIEGTLDRSKTILDSTSGNAGIAYAMIGAATGYKVELVMPGNASEERKKRVKAHGATITETDPLLGYDEAMREAKRRYEANPGKYFFCNQYANDNNWRAHYETTGSEILSQVPNITHFVAGVGTGGTITGVGRKLKQHNKNIKIICIEPEDWRGIEGLKPLDEDNIVPEILDETVIDQKMSINLDVAIDMAHDVAAQGIFVGQSSGAYLVAANQIAQKENKAVIVTIFNDLGERYFSTGMWNR
jgi:cysteine synthase B